METASMSMPAARATSDAVLDVLLWLGLWLGLWLWLFLWELPPPSVVGGDGSRGGGTAGVSVARRTSPIARGTSDVIIGAVWVIVVDMGHVDGIKLRGMEVQRNILVWSGEVR